MSEAEIVFVKRCMEWAFHSVGEGFCEPEDFFVDYTDATDDEGWETLAARMHAKIVELAA